MLLTQWLSDRKKRQLQKKDVGELTAIITVSHTDWFPSKCLSLLTRFCSLHYSEIQRRIELIQDFEMPTVCTSIKVSRDGQFILAAGKRYKAIFPPKSLLFSKLWNNSRSPWIYQSQSKSEYLINLWGKYVVKSFLQTVVSLQFLNNS